MENYVNTSQCVFQGLLTSDISKNELAGKLGTISETLSRILRKLKDSGSIEVKGKDITILDENPLQSIADGEKI